MKQLSSITTETSVQEVLQYVDSSVLLKIINDKLPRLTVPEVLYAYWWQLTEHRIVEGDRLANLHEEIGTLLNKSYADPAETLSAMDTARYNLKKQRLLNKRFGRSMDLQNRVWAKIQELEDK